MAPSVSSTRYRAPPTLNIVTLRKHLNLQNNSDYEIIRTSIYTALDAYRDSNGNPLYRAYIAWNADQTVLARLAAVFLDEDRNGVRYWPDEPGQPFYTGLKYSESRERIQEYVENLFYNLHNNKFRSLKPKTEFLYRNRDLGLTQDNAIPINDADNTEDGSGLHLTASRVARMGKRRKRRRTAFAIPPERRSSRERQPRTDPDKATDAEIDEATRDTRSLSPIPSVKDARQPAASTQEANYLEEAVDMAMDQIMTEDASAAPDDAAVGQEPVAHFVQLSQPPAPEAVMVPSTNLGSPAASNLRIGDLDGLYPPTQFRLIPNRPLEEPPSSRSFAAFQATVEDAPEVEEDDNRARCFPSPTSPTRPLPTEQEPRPQREPIPAPAPASPRPGDASMLPPPIPPTRRSEFDLTFFVIQSRTPHYKGASWEPSKNFNGMSLSELEAEVLPRAPADSKGLLLTLDGAKTTVSMKVHRGNKGEHTAMVKRFQRLITNRTAEIRDQHLDFSIEIEPLLDSQSSVDHMEISNDDDYDEESVWSNNR
ncbi:hypothetical protein B0I35DRAFT_515069 [Stachybotrys elegans]|uniref:Uncharacterized protein n=1 Tax=Stachybotrys elegans TaxID=80388 RepID=A0A8K0WN28_9HYPO|nr:hypothetical protein B0I35DRAFT_515069 [Stachybotrys elegans]